MGEREPIGQWEQWERENVPDNMAYVWHRGDRSFYITLYRETPENSSYRLFDQLYAPLGTTIDFNEQEEAFLRAKELAKNSHRVMHTRYDHKDFVAEGPMTAPYRALEGHEGMHKVGPNEWIEIDGKYYYVEDFN